MPPPPPRQHGVKGVYYGGEWLDIEDCASKFSVDESKCSGCRSSGPCPRSTSRNCSKSNGTYDVAIVGAGCIGAAVARELSKFNINVIWLEAADDVSQGATKGNSGIVHAGYDDKPGSMHAKFCWKGNQMFAQLDRELRFGYQLNGSLVVGFNQDDRKHLEELMKRGEANGVQRLRIVEQDELRTMEPHISEEATCALYSPDAGNVIPYEFTIALAENAVDNGVELRIRREVQAIETTNDGFELTLRHWEPAEYVAAVQPKDNTKLVAAVAAASALVGYFVADSILQWVLYVVLATVSAALLLLPKSSQSAAGGRLSKLVAQAGKPVGTGGTQVEVDDMLVGGSGSSRIMKGSTVEIESVKAKYVINCAGGASDKVARMIGDDSFKILPRVGDYILLHRKEGHLAKHTLFPCPDPILGKGVLVQTTLWGNLILGPTARDMHKPEARDMSTASIQEYILSKCKRLVSKFDPARTIHTFAGARAKSDRGDWIIEPSSKNPHFIHVAGIDSPGLAGSPAIALEVVRLLQEAGLQTPADPNFNPNRAPLITPKVGLRGLKMGDVQDMEEYDSQGTDEAKMAANVICKCERVTELEIVRAMRRSLPIDSTQGIRKRTRAGMGSCQASPIKYNCEARVRAIIARENGVPIEQVGTRPWPATSLLTQRWIDEEEKQELVKRMNG